MKQVTIKAGNSISEPLVLAHKQLTTVFLPATTEVMSILGGHDIDNVGPVFVAGKPISVEGQPLYSTHVLDADAFEGVQVLYFKVPNPVEKDFTFWVYLKAF
jgi:hypothetical protein